MYVLEDLAWRRATAVDVAHDLGVGIELDQVVDVEGTHGAQQQAPGLQVRLHVGAPSVSLWSVP